jgi:hypothetical protein
MMRRLHMGTALLLAAGVSGVAAAQSCTTPASASSLTRTCSVTVTTNPAAGSWVVNRLGAMTLSSAATLVLTSPTVAAFDANVLQETAANTRTLTVKANAPWTINVSPNTAASPSLWTAANDATYGAFVPAEVDKPSTDLKVSTTLGSGYLALPANNTGNTTLLSGQAATASKVVTVFFSTVWFYQFDRPGTYTLPFQFKLLIP